MTKSVAARAAERRREAGRMGILLDAKLLPLYRDSPSRTDAGLAIRADAPSARFVGFASFGRFTAGVVGDLCRLQVLHFAQDGSVWFGPVKLPRLGVEVFPSQPCLFAMALEGSGEVQIVFGWLQAGLVEEEGGDQMWVAADDAELAAELLLPVSHGIGYSLPPPGAGGGGINHAES
jgi:hypothetical protein